MHPVLLQVHSHADPHTHEWFHLLLLGFLLPLTIILWRQLRKNHIQRTEQLRTTQSLLDRYTTTLEAVNEGIWEWHVPTNKVSFSPRYFTMLDYEPDEFPHEFDTWVRLLHPDDREFVTQKITTLVSAPNFKHFQTEFRLRAKEGDYRWIMSRGKAVKTTHDGKPLRIVGTHVDITESHNTLLQLRNEQERFQRLAQNTGTGIVVVDTEHTILEANEPYVRMLGYDSPDQLIGRNTTEFTPSSYMDAKCQAVLETKRTCSLINFETAYTRRDGKLIHVLLNASYDTRPDGTPCFIGFCKDITELRHARDIIDQQLQQLQQTNAKLEQFTYTASHDLQEPLRTITSYSSLLQQDLDSDLPPQAQEDLDFICEATQRMQTLIHDLLELSRAGRTLNPQELQPTPLQPLLEITLKDLRSTIKETEATITLPDTPLPTLNVHPTQFRRVLLNILSNALKFHLPDKPPHIIIEHHPSPPDHHTITITDHGIGIEYQHQEKIFTPFARLHSRDQYPGNGIGLTVCQQIIQAHQGSISIKSEKNKGSSISITLPLLATLSTIPPPIIEGPLQESLSETKPEKGNRPLSTLPTQPS